jgi:hypothetical protein
MGKLAWLLAVSLAAVMAVLPVRGAVASQGTVVANTSSCRPTAWRGRWAMPVA